MESPRILLAGCGDIGLRLAELLKASDTNWQISALRRNIDALPAWLSAIKADLSQPVSELPEFDYLVVTMTPGNFDEESYRQAYVEGTRNLLQALPSRPKMVLWVSSTGVYGQSDGEWVDELSETQPKGFSGQVMLEAEQLIRQHSPDNCVVRFSGIYGPGRNFLLNQVREGKGVPDRPIQWTNRIHADDCAGVLAHLLHQHLKGQSLESLYLATDCASVSRQEVEAWLAEQLSVSLKRESQQRLVRGNRRCSNQRLLDSGYRFKYRDYKAGYGSLLAEQA